MGEQNFLVLFHCPGCSEAGMVQGPPAEHLFVCGCGRHLVITANVLTMDQQVNLLGCENG